jgi:predicted DNA-binding transcriptional regulator AlpA
MTKILDDKVNGQAGAAAGDDAADRSGQASADVGTQDKAATLDDVTRLLHGIKTAITAGQAELLDADAAAALIGVSRATWDRMRSAGLVPAPVKLKSGATVKLKNGSTTVACGSIIRWRRADLAKWIEDSCPPCR